MTRAFLAGETVQIGPHVGLIIGIYDGKALVDCTDGKVRLAASNAMWSTAVRCHRVLRGKELVVEVEK